MERADLILTGFRRDQEEAPSLGTPVLVLREVTERTEGIRAGVAWMVGTDTGRIAAEARVLLDDPGALAAITQCGDLYGDGHAAHRCLAALALYLQLLPAEAPVTARWLRTSDSNSGPTTFW